MKINDKYSEQKDIVKTHNEIKKPDKPMIMYNQSLKSQSQCAVQVVTYLPHLLLAGGDYDDGHGHGHGHSGGDDGDNLISGAFSLVLVEKSFLAIFSANHKVQLLVFPRLYSESEMFIGQTQNSPVFNILLKYFNPPTLTVPIVQVEALHRLMVEHGILGSNPQQSPNPTSAGEVLLLK